VKRFLKILFVFTAMFALAPAKLFACAACYGRSDSAMAVGMNWGIFTLLGFVITVLGAFLAFLIYAIRKSEALNAEKEKAKDV
jgi:hypothetical protein